MLARALLVPGSTASRSRSVASPSSARRSPCGDSPASSSAPLVRSTIDGDLRSDDRALTGNDLANLALEAH